MYHSCQDEDSIGVTLIAKSVLLGERVFVLDLVIILLLRIKIFISLLARLNLNSSTNCLRFILSDLVKPNET